MTKTWKYEDAMRVISEDIWKDSLFNQEEREKVFWEYLWEAKDYEESEKKQTKKKMKEDFYTLLQETQKKFKDDFTLLSKFYKVCKYFSNDPRFKVLDEKDWEDYF